MILADANLLAGYNPLATSYFLSAERYVDVLLSEDILVRSKISFPSRNALNGHFFTGDWHRTRYLLLYHILVQMDVFRLCCLLFRNEFFLANREANVFIAGRSCA